MTTGDVLTGNDAITTTDLLPTTRVRTLARSWRGIPSAGGIYLMGSLILWSKIWTSHPTTTPTSPATTPQPVSGSSSKAAAPGSRRAGHRHRVRRGRDKRSVICMDEFESLNLLPRPGKQWAARRRHVEAAWHDGGRGETVCGKASWAQRPQAGRGGSRRGAPAPPRTRRSLLSPGRTPHDITG